MSYFSQQIYKKENASLKKTVFLDRDGTLISEIEYLSSPSQVHLLPKVAEGIKRLNDDNTVLIVVSNQPVVARGLATIKGVKVINNTLVKMLNKKNASVNGIYFCPHHPEKHHTDISKSAMQYRIACDCRKPKLGMFKKAIENFNINLKNAFIVGDSTRDIKAGKDLGIVTILVGTGSKGLDNIYSVKPDYVASNFNDAVDIICKQ